MQCDIEEDDFDDQESDPGEVNFDINKLRSLAVCGELAVSSENRELETAASGEVVAESEVDSQPKMKRRRRRKRKKPAEEHAEEDGKSAQKGRRGHIKPGICEKCGQWFNRTGNMYMHMRVSFMSLFYFWTFNETRALCMCRASMKRRRI